MNLRVSEARRRRKGRTAGSEISPGNSISRSSSEAFPPSFPVARVNLRKLFFLFFFRDDFLFLFSVSSVHCRERRGQLRPLRRGGGGETFRSIRSKWPARSFPFSRMNFRRIDLCSRKRALWKFKVLKSKFLEATTSRGTLKKLPLLKNGTASKEFLFTALPKASSPATPPPPRGIYVRRI